MISGVLFTILLAFFVSWCAKRAGYFTLPLKEEPYPLSFGEMIGGFVLYALITFILFPVLVLLVSYSVTGQLKSAAPLLPQEKLYAIQLGIFALLFLTLLLYLYMLKPESRKEILWGDKRETSGRNIGLGALTLVIAYPVVLLVSVVTGHLSLYFFGKSGVEQAAVQQLKALTHSPVLFTLMAIGVIFVVPFVEELLFRGLLQTYLRRFLGRGGAIVVTSLLFASAHFAKGHGTGNIELISSLFALSCYLGFLYERQRSLIAPYALHLFFNASTILAIAWR